MFNLIWLLPVLGVLFFVIYTIWLRSRYAQKKSSPKKLETKTVSPPDDHLLFLAKCGFGTEKARELWQLIYGSKGSEDYYTVYMYASMKHKKWYLRLTEAEKRDFEWKNLWNELTVVVEKDPGYWVHQPRLLDFVFRVRSYTG